MHADQTESRLHESMIENAKLIKEAIELRKWEEKKKAIRHYISIVQPLSEYAAQLILSQFVANV